MSRKKKKASFQKKNNTSRKIVDIIENEENTAPRKLDLLIEDMEKRQNDEETSPLASEAESSDSSSSSSSELEDEDGALINPEVDAQVLKTWILLRKKDPKIYDPNSKLYDESVFDTAEKAWLEKKEEMQEQQKKLTLSEMARERLEQGIVDSEDEDEISASHSNPLPPVEEQYQLKNAFLIAVNEAENENEPFFEKNNASLKTKDDAADEFFSVKQKTEEELDIEQRQFYHGIMASLSKDDARFLDVFSNAQANPEDEFLLRYVLNKGWAEPPTLMTKDTFHALERDEKEIEATDAFEQTYNLRFEQTHLTPCPRQVPESLRQKKETRKLARQRKTERKRAVKQQMIDEIKKEKRQLRGSLSNNEHSLDLDRLDFEDVVDGQPVRFPYKQVRPSSFGLTAEEILVADDEELNQLIPVRQLAPYGDPELEIIQEKRKKRKITEFRTQRHRRPNP